LNHTVSLSRIEKILSASWTALAANPEYSDPGGHQSLNRATEKSPHGGIKTWDLRPPYGQLDVLTFHGSFDAPNQVAYFKWLSEQANGTRRLGLGLQICV
jgi:hypothetical protein